jgi:hypothetical protein
MAPVRDSQIQNESAPGSERWVCATEGGLSAEVRCDACGAAMKPMGHCKYWCLSCGFLRTCNDTV